MWSRQAESYLAAFKAANLDIVRCIEVPWDEHAVATQPTYNLIPQALDMALQGLPFLLVWELAVPPEPRR